MNVMALSNLGFSLAEETSHAPDDDVTDEQLAEYRAFEAAIGDRGMVELCDMALAGSAVARCICGRAMRHAQRDAY